MKKQIIISAALITMAFCACTNSAKDEYKNSVDNFASYVDSVDRMEPVYTESQWGIIDNGYNERMEKVQAFKESEADKDARIEESKAKYKALHEKYDAKIKAAKEANDPEVIANRARQDLRNQLLGENKLGADNKWDFVTTENIVSVYENFVDKVRRNGDNYKDEDWIEVRSLWKSLNARKDEIDKDMSTKDNAKVAGLRIAFTAVKSVSKPLSKVKEDIRENKDK